MTRFVELLFGLFRAVALSLFFPFAASAETGLLYTTDFEEFCVGPDFWAGYHLWLGNSSGVGAHGIDEGKSAGFGKTSYLGYRPPTEQLVSVARSINHDPESSGAAVVEFDTLFGIEESKNGRYDNFFVSFYNMEGNFLAALQLSNERGASFGLWRDDGAGLYDTGVDFVHGQLYRFVFTIDLIQNTWSSSLFISPTEGAPLFTDQPFTATSHTRTLGPVAYEWLISSGTQDTEGFYSEHGDNWMLVADCSAWAIPSAEESLVLTPSSFEPGRDASFSFMGEPGWTYQIEYADELVHWKKDLPGSTFVVSGSSQTLSFDDQTPDPPGFRYYRLTREVTP